jgi:hypothetical protein
MSAAQSMAAHVDAADLCSDPQCREFRHTCPGCGNDLHGDNFCMVSACEQEV